MAVFAIADLHLSLGKDKPMDVFSGWNNYVERIEKNWRRLINPDDTVVIAGDISWAMKLEECREDFDFIDKLPGRKIFMKGNHDYWWGTKKKIEDYLEVNNFKTIEILYNNSLSADGISICGSRGWFYDVQDSTNKKILDREVLRLKRSIESAEYENPVVFLHYPPVYGDYVCDEIMQVLKQYEIKKCYYGHIHGSMGRKKAVNGELDGINFRLISCDNTDFCPVPIKI